MGGRRRAEDAAGRAPRRPAGDLLPWPLRGRGGRGARHTGRHRQVPDVLRAPGAEAGTRGTGACAMTGSACRNIRQSLGVYVVGAIDPAERARVDSHLSTCPDCREELAGLAGLPALLGRVPAADAERLILHSAEVKDLEEPPDELLGSLLRRVAERRAVRRWRSLGAAAAAVVIALAGGAAGARILNPGSHVPGPVQPASRVEVVSATNPRTNVSAIISYTA